MTAEERLKLIYLSGNRNLAIKQADKGGKIVIMNTWDYIEYCGLLLNDTELYEKLDANPKLSWAERVKRKRKTDDMLKNNYIRNQEYSLAVNMEIPRTPSFYELPKINKIFASFPLLRPIVSGFNSCICNLLIFVDSFLKFEA